MKKRRTLVIKKPNSNKERVPSTRNLFNNNSSSHLSLKDDLNCYVRHKMTNSISEESVLEQIPKLINIEEATKLIESHRHLYTTSNYIHTLNDAWIKKNERLIEVIKLIHLSMVRNILDSKIIIDVIRRLAKEKDRVEKIGKDTLQSIIGYPIRDIIPPYPYTNLFCANMFPVLYNVLNNYTGEVYQELKNIILDNMIETITNQLRHDERIHTRYKTIEKMLDDDLTGFQPNTLYIGNKISGKYGYIGTGKIRYRFYHQSLIQYGYLI